jgi:hypothetical protein
VLYLFLYDVWESLWGKNFADRQVEIESGRTGLYDYKTAWKWGALDQQGAAGFTLCGHRKDQSQVDGGPFLLESWCLVLLADSGLRLGG